jgi:hypothetical protein
MEGTGMTLRAIFGRRWVSCLGLIGAAAAGYVFGLSADRAMAQLPGTPAVLPTPSLPPKDARWVAMIYGNVPVTREELGEFLIARGGYEKVELLVNKKIIEVEAARRNITVTDLEVRKGLEDDLNGMNVSRDDFTKHILPRYNKTLYEWIEDVIKPRLLLTKMCHDRVKVTEDDLKRLYENKYGEQRQAKLICWGGGSEQLKIAQQKWDEARKGDVEFDSVARQQGDPNLAASCGLVAPVGKNAYDNTEGKEATVEKVLFSLKEGELSQLFQLPAGIMCVKCVKIIPPNTSVKLEQVKAALEKEVFEKKLNAEIPKYFAVLKEQARPDVYLKGPPTAREFQQGTTAIMQAGGINPPVVTPGPGMPPVPKKP